MSARRIVTFSMVGLMVIGLSLLTSATIRNERIEQQRMSLLVASKSAVLPGDPQRGRIVGRAGGCIACHTDVENGGALLAGGVRIESAFGTFVSPNITSDPIAGIGTWHVDRLSEALLNGRRADGSHYWPAFPYAAYAATNTQDIVDLYAWLQSTRPSTDVAAEHDLLIPDIARTGLSAWKSLYVRDDYQPDVFSARGEYLIKGPAHCAECHAQRNLVGGVPDRQLSGNSRGPEGASVPAITATALRDWTVEDLEFFLEIGMTPGGDFPGGHMAVVIEQGTAHLPLSDRQAMAAYLKSSVNGAEH